MKVQLMWNFYCYNGGCVIGMVMQNNYSVWSQKGVKSVPNKMS